MGLGTLDIYFEMKEMGPLNEKMLVITDYNGDSNQNCNGNHSSPVRKSILKHSGGGERGILNHYGEQYGDFSNI